jgi:dolichyl-phosphate-mannose-protein mannosyltransferase
VAGGARVAKNPPAAYWCAMVGSRGPRDAPTRLLVALAAFGLGLVVVGSLLNWARLVYLLGLPAGELTNPWVQQEFITIRIVSAATGLLIIAAAVLLRAAPAMLARLARGVDAAIGEITRTPIAVGLYVTGLIGLTAALQLTLYVTGYQTFSADDFSRALRADYWLHHRTFDVGWGGWLGKVGMGWLPFQDYLVALALAVHRDLFVTPRIVNLIVSAAAVIVAYCLGRELFGRAIGLATATLVALQPWRIWLGMSGMTSDLPGATMIALFALFLARWLRTDRSRDLLFAAAALALGNGFRYEAWLFTLVFSGLVVVMAATKAKQRTVSSRWIATVVGALVIAAAVPAIWMAASRRLLGVWLPELGSVMSFMPVAFAGETSNRGAMIGVPLLAFGSFPFETVLSIGGTALAVVSCRWRILIPYVAVPILAFLLLGFVFKWQLAAYLECGRYFISFAWLLLPVVAYGLGALARANRPWPSAGFCAAAVIVAAIAIHDVGRALNYPDMFPRDALAAGWTLRRLQESGTMRSDGQILIERGEDLGFLAIAVLANAPERFVGLNEAAVYERKLATVPADGPAARNFGQVDLRGARGHSCDNGFEPAACRNSVLEGRFDLVILSSPGQVASFQRVFQVPAWKIGRYHLFDMKSAFHLEK